MIFEHALKESEISGVTQVLESIKEKEDSMEQEKRKFAFRNFQALRLRSVIH